MKRALLLILVAVGVVGGTVVWRRWRDGRVRIDREALSEKADEIERKIRKLCAVRDGLRHAAACRAPDHLQCPTFRRLMGIALAGAARARKVKK